MNIHKVLQRINCIPDFAGLALGWYGKQCRVAGHTWFAGIKMWSSAKKQKAGFNSQKAFIRLHCMNLYVALISCRQCEHKNLLPFFYNGARFFLYSTREKERERGSTEITEACKLLISTNGRMWVFYKVCSNIITASSTQQPVAIKIAWEKKKKSTHFYFQLMLFILVFNLLFFFYTFFAILFHV